MCIDDLCCGCELRTATIVYAGIVIMFDFIHLLYASYGILIIHGIIAASNEYYGVHAYADWTLYFVALIFAIILLVGAFHENELMILIYYVYGIIRCILASLSVVALALLDNLLFIPPTVIFIIAFPLILHFLIKRFYNDL